MITIREITAADDARMAEIIRANFVKFKLDIPGTAYFDPELDHLSTYYMADPETRKYFVMVDENGNVIGGCGFSEFKEYDSCVEMQKLYLTEEVKGKGLGKKLVAHLEDAAKAAGYKKMYLETHTNLAIAIEMYRKLGFIQIQKPDFVNHDAMDHFFIKDLI